MGASGQPPTQSTRTELGPEAKELFGLALPNVRDFAAQTPQRYGGPTVAGFDPSQTAGQEGALTAAGTQDNLATSGVNATNYWLSPDAIDIGRDQGIRSAIDASVRPIGQQLTEQVLPNIRSGSVSNGTFGSSRQGIAEGLASGRASQAVGDTAAKVAETAREANVKAQMQALGLLPQTQQATTSGATTTSAVGDIRQQQEQRGLDANAAAFNFDQYAPFLQSKEILSLLSGLPNSTTTTTGSVAPQTPLWQKSLGGAATGASLGSAFGPIGTGVGALGGATLPFLFK